MAEYIDREMALKAIDEYFNTTNPDGDEQIGVLKSRKVIRVLPAADVSQVVHAEWLDIVFDPMRRSMKATCSHCMVRGVVRVKGNECGFAVPDSDFCPSCGAMMDLRRRDDGA